MQLGPVLGIPNVLSVVFDPVRPGVAYAELDTGEVVRSDDGGATWSLASRVPVDAPPVPVAPVDFAPDPGDPGTLYVAGYGGLFRTHDHGATWTRLGGRVAYDEAYSVAIDPLGGRQIYVGLHTATDGPGIYVSHDGGTSFARAAQQVPQSIVISPADPRTVWAVHQLDVVVSRDRGVDWQAALYTGASYSAPACLFADRTAPATAWVGAAAAGANHMAALGLHGAPLVETTDGGRHWQALAAGFPLRSTSRVWRRTPPRRARSSLPPTTTSSTAPTAAPPGRTPAPASSPTPR
jgi:hypothetical protein